MMLLEIGEEEVEEKEEGLVPTVANTRVQTNLKSRSSRDHMRGLFLFCMFFSPSSF